MSLPIPELVSHTQRVKALYKMAIRNLESWYDRREVFRYVATLMRAKFDRYKNVKDFAAMNELVRKGEEELFLYKHWHIRKHACTPFGSSYEREVPAPDWIIDYWHPLEKAEYPTYFAKREVLKKKYVEMWKDQYSR
ncbi:hypothetical protein Trydic_g16075 [Trypoxylus dichotomus]